MIDLHQAAPRKETMMFEVHKALEQVGAAIESLWANCFHPVMIRRSAADPDQYWGYKASREKRPLLWAHPPKHVLVPVADFSYIANDVRWYFARDNGYSIADQIFGDISTIPEWATHVVGIWGGFTPQKTH